MAIYSLDDIKYAYIKGYALKNLKLEPNILSIINKNLLELNEKDKEILDNLAINHQIKLYYFKKKEILARISIALGFIKAIYPKKILDIGTGRGLFLFPLLEQIDGISVTSMDILPKRVEMLEEIRLGGINSIYPMLEDITSTTLEDNFDVVTMLEVLEHIPNYKKAIENAIRLSSKYIVITVPSKPDDNPEHIHLLTMDKLKEAFNEQGIYNLQFGGVNKHLFLIAKKEG